MILPTLDVHRGFPIRATVLMFQDATATVPADLTGCTFEAVIGRPDGAALLTLTVTPVDLTAGEILVESDAEPTLQLTGTLYAWSLIVIEPDGHREVIPMGPVNVSTPGGTKTN